MLLEAKAQVARGEWTNWVERNFKLSHTTANVYMKLAIEQINTPSINFKSLNEFKAEHLGYKQTVHPAPWHEPVKQEMADPALIERMRRDTQTKLAESKLTAQIYMRLARVSEPCENPNESSKKS